MHPQSSILPYCMYPPSMMVDSGMRRQVVLEDSGDPICEPALGVVPISLSRLKVLVLLLTTAVGCRGIDHDRASRNSAPPTVPVFRHHSLPLSDTHFVNRNVKSIAMTDDGIIGMLYTSGPGDHTLMLVDATMGELRYTVPRGMREGESSGAGMLFAHGNVIEIVDTLRSRIITVTEHGGVVREDSLPENQIILSVSSDSIDVMPFHNMGNGVSRRPRRGNGGLELVANTDPYLRWWSSRHTATWATVPAYYARAAKMVLGEGIMYRLVLLDRAARGHMEFGRELPPRYRTDAEHSHFARLLLAIAEENVDSVTLVGEIASTRSQVLPHFGRSGVWIDPSGRVWVVGSASDSTFVDIFADGVYIGRTMIDCWGSNDRIAYAAGWMALLCRGQASKTESSYDLLIVYTWDG